jgi:hypothetical protein
MTARGEKRSARGLIARTTLPAVENVEFWNQDTADRIKSYIATLTDFLNAPAAPRPQKIGKLRRRGGGTIRASVPEKTDSQILDSKAAAAYALKSLAKVRIYLSELGKCSDLPPSARNYALAAVDAALIFASALHQWTIVDNEKSIADLIVSKDAGKRGPAEKVRQLLPRNVDMAKEFEANLQKSRKSETSLMAEIGRKKHGLRRSASIDAVKKGLAEMKKSSGYRGKPNK